MTRLNVLISGGFTGAYQQLLPGFEQASGIKVMTGSGASQGTGPHAIAAQLARSVPADVVILSREASTNCSLLGVSLRERISTWRARRSAWRCGRVRTDLFPRLGIAERIRIVVGPRGTDATDMVAAGRADIAVMPTSEIVYAAGVDFAGNIAPEIQFVQTFSAAIVAGSGEIEAAKTADRPSRLRTGFGSHPEKRNGANRVVTRLAALGKIWPRFFKTLGRSARRRLEMLQSPALCRNRH